MRRTLTVLATAASMILLVCGVAGADTVGTDFEGFTLGSVNGQDGWKSDVPGDIPSLPNGYDQEVVANTPPAPARFESKSLRLSNAYGTAPDTAPPEFELQTYSKPTTDPAGEDLATREYTAQFSFISIYPDRLQPRLQISVSPDNGHGGRMSYIGLSDTPSGINVTFYDTPLDAKGEYDWVAYDLATLPRNEVHTIKFLMKLVPGPNNDLVRISIDGQDVGHCFTTWENFYRQTSQAVPISDRLLFLSGNRDGDRLSLLGGGYLFDDVTTTTANGLFVSRGCDLVIDKDADQRTVVAGGSAGYQITVRNRGRLAARRLRVCDHLPRGMTFVRADRRLRRLGRLRCLTIPSLRPGQRVSFHLVLQVNANAPPATVTNIADIIPDIPGLPPAGEPGTPPALPPGAVIAKIKAIVKARAVVRILKRVKAERAQRRSARPARTRPPFTG
jgi:uncharacterized repeat protein (TIGR01451 family)